MTSKGNKGFDGHGLIEWLGARCKGELKDPFGTSGQCDTWGPISRGVRSVIERVSEALSYRVLLERGKSRSPSSTQICLGHMLRPFEARALQTFSVTANIHTRGHSAALLTAPNETGQATARDNANQANCQSKCRRPPPHSLAYCDNPIHFARLTPAFVQTRPDLWGTWLLRLCSSRREAPCISIALPTRAHGKWSFYIPARPLPRDRCFVPRPT